MKKYKSEYRGVSRRKLLAILVNQDSTEGYKFKNFSQVF